LWSKHLPQVTARRAIECLSVSICLVTWVANGEFLQGITNGLLCTPAHDKPAFVTWFSCNYMMLSMLFVVHPCVHWFKKWTLLFHLENVWAQNLGLKRAVASCSVISYLLLALNILLVIGLECMSVSLSNAMYQLQTVFAVGLSVWLVKDRFVLSQALGMFLSTAGVAMIVLPPLLSNNSNDGEDLLSPPTQHQTCPIRSAPPLVVGTIATLASAAIGGIYLVSWRVLWEKKEGTSESANHPVHETRLEGFVDAHMTLAMIGGCNFLLGWPILFLAHFLDLESFELPPTACHWWILNWNGLVECSFDTSCAVTIYMTSPLVTPITAPLTIPLSLMTDQMLCPSSNSTKTASEGGAWGWLGAVVILLGVVLLETKPNLAKSSRWCWNRKLERKKKWDDEEQQRLLVEAV
jgi:drug/metabolite transporter (DMT)-like permease